MSKEITKKTVEELQKAVVDMRDKIRSIRHATAGSRSSNVNESRTIRRDIARNLTELRARKLAADKVALAETKKNA
jgi:ribosomal protein L29